jgi:hypothetical protein
MLFNWFQLTKPDMAHIWATVRLMQPKLFVSHDEIFALLRSIIPAFDVSFQLFDGPFSFGFCFI